MNTHISVPAREIVDAVLNLIHSQLGEKVPVIGLCGAQGSGKTTLARAVANVLAAEGINCATLSLDDLYLTKAERAGLARRVHPLLETRGVPGTHDVDLGLAVLDCLVSGSPVELPRFSKALDDRVPPAEWPVIAAGCQVVLFEGWCVGARPQDEAELLSPVNALEQNEDRGGSWRLYANRCLAGRYQDLFKRLDALVLLAAPSFNVVARWRLEQERELGQGPAVMDGSGVERFVRHYERLTRHILAEMPRRADLIAELDDNRRILRLVQRANSSETR